MHALQRDTVYDVVHGQGVSGVDQFVGRTVAELQGVKLAQFSDFRLF